MTGYGEGLRRFEGTGLGLHGFPVFCFWFGHEGNGLVNDLIDVD